MKHSFQFYAVVLPGLESIAAQELNSFAAHEVRVDASGVRFAGSLDLLYRVSLRARCITRIQVRVGKCHAMSLPELQHHIAAMAWQRFIPQGADITVKASSEHSKLIHSEHIAEHVLAGIHDALGKRLQKRGESKQCVYIHINNNRCEIRMDASGERLDRRGYRLQSAKAPMRETLAAGILQWMAWKPDETLMVPMCGSGTVAIEAGLMAMKCAANLSHAFPFKDWDVFKEKSWQRVLEKTIAMQQDDVKVSLHASDIHAGAIKATTENAKRAQVLEYLTLTQQDIFKMKKSPEQGLVVCNPPYGLRIEADSVKFYRQLGHLLKDEFPDWRMVVLCPDWKLEKALAMPVQRRMRVLHGGLWLDVLDVSVKKNKPVPPW